jgi:hypothetical protein
VRITAADPSVEGAVSGTIAAAPNPLMLQMSDHVYPSPAKSMDAGYKVGQHWAFIAIGDHALNDTTAQRKLYGNYGVTYNINVKVSNPTQEEKKVSFIFDPTAGPASGAFFIDGKFVSVRYAQPPSEITLRWFTLSAGETRNFRVQTVPLAGSNYPATLIVKS